MARFLSRQTAGKLNNYLEGLGRGRLIAAALAVVLVIGGGDYLTGPLYSATIFYLIPIAVSAWYGGRRAGILVSVVSAAALLVASLLHIQIYLYAEALYWNDAVALGFFLIIVHLLASLKESIERERREARRDPLTQVANRKYFYELAELEVKRSQRYGNPLTVVYIDIDNFKEVNDALGHEEGDRLLQTVAETIRTNIRGADVLARLGGDEFVLLLPEIDYTAAVRVVEKIQQALRAAPKPRGVAATLSIGAVTYRAAPLSVAEMVKSADALMYEVKREGKNMIRHRVEDAHSSALSGSIPRCGQ